MDNKRTVQIEKIIQDGEITHWTVTVSNGREATAPTFLDAWEEAYELVTGDFGHLQHDGWADFPDPWKEV